MAESGRFCTILFSVLFLPSSRGCFMRFGSSLLWFYFLPFPAGSAVLDLARSRDRHRVSVSVWLSAKTSFIFFGFGCDAVFITCRCWRCQTGCQHAPCSLQSIPVHSVQHELLARSFASCLDIASFVWYSTRVTFVHYRSCLCLPIFIAFRESFSRAPHHWPLQARRGHDGVAIGGTAKKGQLGTQRLSENRFWRSGTEEWFLRDGCRCCCVLSSLGGPRCKAEDETHASHAFHAGPGSALRQELIDDRPIVRIYAHIFQYDLLSQALEIILQQRIHAREAYGAWF